MADQQQALALLAFARRQQVAGALHFGRHVDPAGLEAQLVELFAEHLADFAHAFVVHGAAVDVDRALQQLQALSGVRLHFGDDLLFDG